MLVSACLKWPHMEVVEWSARLARKLRFRVRRLLAPLSMMHILMLILRFDDLLLQIAFDLMKMRPRQGRKRIINALA